MKKTLALLLALCMAFSMFSVVAFADTSATLNVALVDENGEAVTEIKAGESVWAVISVANYAEYVGDAAINWDADDLVTESEYDKTIAVVTTYLELDTDVFAAATDDNGLVWESPYKSDIEGQDGSMDYNQDGDYLKTLLQTDCEGGVFYSITKSELDANNGELYRIKLTAADDAAVGSYSVGLYGGDGITAPGIATISSAAGEATVTTADVPVAMGAAAPIAIYSDDIVVVEPESYTIVDATEGFVYDDWTLNKNGGSYTVTTAEDATKGTYTLTGSVWSQTAALEYNDAYYFDGVDVTFEGTTNLVRYHNNNMRVDSTATYTGVALGGLEFRMEQYTIPQIWYNGEKIAQGEPIIATYYELDENGDYALDEEGNRIVATDEEGNALYETWAKYIEAVKFALSAYSAVEATHTIEVVDGVVKGYITTSQIAKTEVVSVALPEGAFAKAVKPAVITGGSFAFVDAYITGAKLVAEKVITDVDAKPFIAKAPFNTNWTIVAGRLIGDGERSDTYIAEDGSFIQTGSYNGDIIVKHAKAFTGDDFYIEYTVKRETYMGNGNTGGERYGVRVGDFYFALNQDGQLPYVEYAGNPVYQGTEVIWDLVGASDDAVAAIEEKEFKNQTYEWAAYYEGSNPTYRISLKDNKLKVTYQSSNFAETVIVPEMTVNFGEFKDAQVSLGGNQASNYSGHERFTSFYMDNNLHMTKVDLGLLNAQMNAFVVRDYANVPSFVKTVVTIAGALTDADKAILTEENIAKAQNFAAKAEAYATLGTVTISNSLVNGFAADAWVSINNTAVTTSEYGVMRYFKNGTFTATGSTYDLSNGFRAGLDIIKQSYNRDPEQHTDIIVGAIKVSLEADTIVIYNGDTVVATAESAITYNADNTAAAYATVAEAVGGMTGNTHAKIDVEYKNGVVTVTVNGTVMATAAVKADLSAAEVEVVHYDNKWNRALLYNYYLYTGETVVNLFELNEQLAELANVNDWKNYSEIAATADAIIPQLSAEKLEAMYNLPIYEAYKEAYATAAKGITYKLINGFYDYEWTDVKTAGGYLIRGEEEIEYLDTNSEIATKTVSYPDTALYMENVRGHQTMKSKNVLTTPGYFKITYQGEGAYYNDRYIKWTVGDLAIRSVLDAANPSPEDTAYSNNVVFEVIYKGEVIKTITGTAVAGVNSTVDNCSAWMYVNCKFTITYDNGNLLITFYNGADKYVTAKEGLDLTALVEGFNYDPNGNQVELDVYTSYSQFAVKNVTVTGKVNADAVEGLDALATTDAASAKLIYDSLSDKSVVSAETKALMDTEFAVSADEGLSYTYTIDGISDTTYRYGDTLVLVGEGTDELGFGGWYDAEGNLLSTDKEYAVVVAPGVTVVAKGCVHEAGETVNQNDATCGEDGYTGDVLCSICGCVITEGEVIEATGDHAWGDWVANEDGITETRECGTCGATETQDIVVDECAHEWSAWEITTEATATTAGEKTRTCGLCGATETQEYTIETSGTTGDVTWRFEDGTLYIEGTGAMGNYVNVGDVAPWQTVRTETTAIVIGDGVTYIGNRAFKGFNKVTSVTFGKDVATTGYECFYNCTAIETITLNEGLTSLGALCFYNCGFASVEIPSTMTNLANRAFKNCKNLTSVDIPNTVTTTGYEVFMGCTSLASVDFTTGCNMINPLVFSGCTSLTDFYVPKNVVRIRTQAFAGCTALATITFEDDDTLFASATDGKIASDSFSGCPSTLTFKGWMAGNASLYASQRGFKFEATNTSIFTYTLDADNNATITGMRGEYTTCDIPATVDGHTVVAIGTAAFRDNTRLTRISIPATVTTIGGRAFQDCTNLATITGVENATTIQYSAFQGCTALTSVSFNAALTTINANTFNGCAALGEIYVPNTITTVHNTAFTGCTNAVIKTQAGSAAAKAAASQSVATKIVTDFDYTVNADGESVTVTGVLGNVTELVIPDEINGYKVTAIQQRAFKNNTTLTSVVIGNNVTTLLYETFMNCTNITSVTVGTGVTATGANTFGGMTNLESITFLGEGISFHANTFLNSNANLTVYGVAGSSTQTFATSKGFTFVAL